MKLLSLRDTLDNRAIISHAVKWREQRASDWMNLAKTERLFALLLACPAPFVMCQSIRSMSESYLILAALALWSLFGILAGFAWGRSSFCSHRAVVLWAEADALRNKLRDWQASVYIR